MSKKIKPKKKKNNRMYSTSGLKRAIKETADDAVRRVLLITITAAADEFNLDQDQIVSLAERMQRYVKYEADGVISMDSVSEVLHDSTGIDLRFTRGW